METKTVDLKTRARRPKLKKRPFSEVDVTSDVNAVCVATDPHLIIDLEDPQPRPKGRENSLKQVRKRARGGALDGVNLPAGEQQSIGVYGKETTSPMVSEVSAAGISPQSALLLKKTTIKSPPTPDCASLSPPDRVKPRRLRFESDGKNHAEVVRASAVGRAKTARKGNQKTKSKSLKIKSTTKEDLQKKRRSLRIAESTQKKSNSKSKKRCSKPSPEVEFRKLLEKPDRKPTCRTGKSLQDEQNRRLLKKLVFEDVEYKTGDDVYVRRGKENDAEVCELEEGLASDSDAEVEECVLCGEAGKEVMVECDECLGGYHLSCLNPPLEEVPEGDWNCANCEALAVGGKVEQLAPKKRKRTARERFLAEEIWAARIEKLWCRTDGTFCFQGRWWAIPEETADGRQPWHGRRELFLSNMVDENEMDTILRHCYVMTPDEFSRSSQEGDDVFMCGHEYDFRHQTFKRIADEFDDVSGDDSDDESFDPAHGTHANDRDEEEDDNDDDFEDEEDYHSSSKSRQKNRNKSRGRQKGAPTARAANVRKGHIDRIEGVGAKRVPQIRKRPFTDLEKAKAALMLSAAPASLPCRDKEKCEIETFVKDAVAAGEHCLGRCLYISGVPGTGKTATVLEVMKGLRAKVDKEELPPYRFVEINGLRLPSPEHAYTVLHEALTGQHCGWRRALQCLDARFAVSKPLKGVHARPCILLVDELDLLVTRNQSVLYNLFDWPSRANSRLIVIGIANTMDLPERMLPRIASRLGLHRISFGPYSHIQLQEILAARLEGIPAFDKQAVEFASRKVAAVSGDARRALELCRRAAEITELRTLPLPASLTSTDPSHKSPVHPPTQVSQSTKATATISKLIGMADIEAAISEMFQAAHIQMMKRCAKYAKIFLVAVVTEQHRTTMVETTFEKVVMSFMRLCGAHKERCPDVDLLLTIGCKLGACRLLLCEPGIRHRHQKLQLNFPCDDVSFALKDDKELPWLTKYL